ncbi:MAG TPA: hypothetical protein VF952_20670 [Chloroflexia bacterium]|jgi:hypothetical protein
MFDSLRRNPESITIPSGETFQPWSAYSTPNTPRIDTVAVLYHPYQIFRLHKIDQACTTSIRHTDFTISAAALLLRQQIFSGRLERLKEDELEDLGVLELLLAIEDRYLPDIRERLRYEEWFTWSETFSATTVLSGSGYNEEGVQALRIRFAHIGRGVDSAHEWYNLIRFTDYSRRGSLRGNLLRAWDYYEVAELLGKFLSEATGRPQRHVDDLISLNHGAWKQHRYGISADNFDYSSRNALPAVLRYFGLDPRVKLLLAVEGQSETAYASAWCEHEGIAYTRPVHQRGLDIPSLNVRMRELGSVSELKSDRWRRFLQDITTEGAKVFVTVDDEQDAETVIDQLVADRMLHRKLDAQTLLDPKILPEGAMLWRPCFEDASFTFDEQVAAWHLYAQAILGSHFNLAPWQAAVQHARVLLMTQQTQQKPKGMTAIGAIIEAAKKFGMPHRFSKPAFARCLAELYWQADKPMNLMLRKVVGYASQI